MYDMGVSIGSVWIGGTIHYPSYHLKDLLTIARDSLTNRLSDYDFWVTGAEDGGYIRFYAHFAERRGRDKTGVALIERHNVTRVKYQEQGTIVNEWTVAGEGVNWGDSRLTSTASDADSRNTYGLRQGSKVFSDVVYQATLDSHAESLLDTYKEPHDILDLDAINLAPALFQDYGIGDSIQVELPNYGFDGFSGLVKILGRDYSPVGKFCRLVVRVE